MASKPVSVSLDENGKVSHSSVRDMLRKVALSKGEWAGIPMPIEGQRMIIEPSHPLAGILTTVWQKPGEGSDDDFTLVNSWWSSKERANIYVWSHPECHRLVAKSHAVHTLKIQLQTLGCAHVWGLEQEANALKLLSSMLRPHSFNQYVMTGMFLETSKRSGVTYLFRRLRPTLASRPDKNDDMRILAALCMHPIAYYYESWAGAMCSTDDVIAHLAMMRGDEYMFWKRCNQHPAHKPEAGLI